MPHDAVWVDTETIGLDNGDAEERHVLNFGFAAYSRTRGPDDWIQPEWLRFTKIGQFWDWVLSRLHGRTRLYVFAHNWAFDAPVLDTFNYLPQEGWQLKSAVIQSPPVILNWRKAPYTILMVDTLNIWRMSLAKLGESIGFEKLKMPDHDASREEWDRYCKQDVAVIMKACFEWWAFLKDNDLGGFANTLAAQGMRTFRHKFMHHDILIDDNERALTLARDAAHGGRTECFYLGEVPEKVYKLDLNSQYPAIMHNEYMPRKLIGHYKQITIDELASWLQWYCAVARCVIETDDTAYGLVHDNKLIFPKGRFETALTTPELLYAIENNHIVTISECAIYEREILFKAYMDYFYNLRRKAIDDGNLVWALQCKLMMNTLSGKWGQKGLFYEKIEDIDDTTIDVWTEIDGETGDVMHFRQYAGIIEQLVGETESRDSHPAIYAHITAHGRMQIHGLGRMAGTRNFYYCDTDSLWCNEQGYDNVRCCLHDTELGRLKLEDTVDHCVLFGPKDYSLNGRSRIKGIRSTATPLGPGLYRQAKFSTLKGLLRRGDLSAPIVKEITKELHRRYTKGIVTESGWIEPFTIRTA